MFNQYLKNVRFWSFHGGTESFDGEVGEVSSSWTWQRTRCLSPSESFVAWIPCRLMDSSPGEAHKEPGRSVSQWWCPPRTGHGCFPPRGSGGSAALSDLEATRVVWSNGNNKQRRPKWNTRRWDFDWPSLNSRLSSWFGQRFTTSVTCSAFL